MASKSRKRPRGAAAHRPRRRLRTGWLIAGGLAIAAGVAVVFVVLQGGGSGGGSGAAAELDDDPALPGLYVDLPGIYLEGPYPATGGHVTGDVDYESLGNSNPPVGGPHWSDARCGETPADSPPFCGPAPWGIFQDEWDPETLVHNMEHAGVVLWYNTSDQELIAELETIIRDRLDDNLLVMAPYSAMEDETIAITSWSRIDKFPVDEYDAGRVERFIDVHARRFNPEGF